MSAYEAIYKIMSTMPVHTGEITAEMRGMITATKTKNIQTILAYPLKVGGTYMRVALIHLLSFHYQAHLSRGSYVAVGPNREPYFPLIFNQHVLTDTTPRAAVMHLHTVATQATTEIVEAFDIPVLIATRNIYDTLVSWANHQEKNLATGGYPDWDFLTENGKPFSEMTAEERRHGLVHFAPLWYARHYGSWLRYSKACMEKGIHPPLWMRYEDLVERPVDLLMAIIQHVDPVHTYSREQAQAALQLAMQDKEAVRFNKGVGGRGDAYFRAEEKQVIYDIIKTAGEPDLIELGVLPNPDVEAERLAS